MIGTYVDDQGRLCHGEIPDGAARDGREWLIRMAREELALAVEALKKVKEGAKAEPITRVLRLGTRFWQATCIDGCRVPKLFGSRKEALAFLAMSDSAIVQNRADEVEHCRRVLAEHMKDASMKGGA